MTNQGPWVLWVFFWMRAFNSQKGNFLCERKGLWTWTWSLTWTCPPTTAHGSHVFFWWKLSTFGETFCVKKLWTWTLTLTWGSPPTDKTNQGPWVFLTVQGFLPENMIRHFRTFSKSTHKRDKQTNLATRGPPESPWQGPWPLLMSPAHSLSMENRWIPELNYFDEKTHSPGCLKVWICFALLESCSETHSWCKCDVMVLIVKCSKKEHLLISGYFKM